MCHFVNYIFIGHYHVHSTVSDNEKEDNHKTPSLPRGNSQKSDRDNMERICIRDYDRSC